MYTKKVYQMTDHKEDIDKLFQDGLSEQTFDIPQEFLEDLDKRLDAHFLQKKKRRGLFWFLLFFIAFLISSSIAFYLKNKTASQTILTQIDSDKNEPLLEKTKIQNDSIYTPNLNDDKGGEVIDDSQKEINNNSEISLAKTTHAPKQVSNKEITLGLKETVLKKDNSVQTSKSISFKETDALSNQNITAYPEIKQNVVENESIQSKPLDVNANDSINTTLNIDTFDTQGFSNEEKLLLTEPTEILPKTKKWFVELQLFGDISDVILETNATYNSILSETQGTEEVTTPMGYGLGLKLNYNKWALTSGINKLKIEENVNYNLISISSFDTILQWWEIIWIYDSATHTWDSIYIQMHDTVLIYDTTHLKFNSKNVFEYISIPFYLSYRIDWGRWALIPGIGGVAHIRKNPLSVQYPISKEDKYNTDKFLLTYIATLEIRHQFNRWHIFAQPYYQSALRPSQDINRKYEVYGVRMGLGVRF